MIQKRKRKRKRYHSCSSGGHGALLIDLHVCLVNHFRDLHIGKATFLHTRKLSVIGERPLHSQLLQGRRKRETALQCASRNRDSSVFALPTQDTHGITQGVISGQTSENDKTSNNTKQVPLSRHKLRSQRMHALFVHEALDYCPCSGRVGWQHKQHAVSSLVGQTNSTHRHATNLLGVRE